MASSLVLKNTIVLLLLASLISASFAGAPRKFMDRQTVQVGVVPKGIPRKLFHKAKVIGFHPRILKVKTNDYGSNDPAPALEKPPFKLIPN